MTLEALAEFFGAEFALRCDFLRDFIISYSSLCKEQDNVTTAKILFQTKSFEQKEKLKAAYAVSVKPIAESLRGNSSQQIEESLIARIENRIKKNNVYVEIAYHYQALESEKNAKNPIFVLKPNLYGIGIDIPELFKRYFKHN